MTQKQVLITIIIALLFPISRLVLCCIFSCDFPEIRNLKIHLRSFEDVGPSSQMLTHSLNCSIILTVFESRRLVGAGAKYTTSRVCS